MRKKKPKISQLRVWQILEEAWSDAVTSRQTSYRAAVGYRHCRGLCGSIFALSDHYEFNVLAALEVINAAYPEVPVDEYVWSGGSCGAEDRAAFCRKQVQRLRPKKKKKA